MCAVKDTDRTRSAEREKRSPVHRQHATTKATTKTPSTRTILTVPRQSPKARCLPNAADDGRLGTGVDQSKRPDSADRDAERGHGKNRGPVAELFVQQRNRPPHLDRRVRTGLQACDVVREPHGDDNEHDPRYHELDPEEAHALREWH